MQESPASFYERGIKKYEKLVHINDALNNLIPGSPDAQSSAMKTPGRRRVSSLFRMSLLLITQLPACVAWFTGLVLFNPCFLSVPVNRGTLHQFLKARCNLQTFFNLFHSCTAFPRIISLQLKIFVMKNNSIPFNSVDFCTWSRTVCLFFKRQK